MPGFLTLKDLRGGINNTDSPTLLADNQIVDARNVDFRNGSLGSKRNGTRGINLAGSIINSPVVAIMRHTPTNAISNDELWVLDENGNIDRRVGGTWSGGVARVNDNVVINSRNYEANGVSLHGKLFIAARGTYDRLLVWDGSVLRWAGFFQTPDPSLAETAVAGSYSGTRYFRVRFTAQNAAGATLRRSEPSNTISIVASGTKTGVIVTKPAGTEVSSSPFCEGQTHWEVEASIDNVLFYRIATVVIGTSTYTDTTALATGYSANPLSESIGEYIPPTSVRHVAVDEDRVMGAGSFFTEAEGATVSWTPVAADDGVGNDERIPTTTRNFIRFDGLDGGPVTMLLAGVAGNVYAFKDSRVYKMVRTGIAAQAYSPVSESYSRGATTRGACSGVDANGVPCAYFLDPSVGLCRVGKQGLEDLGKPIRDFWRTRNPTPAIGPRILYYPAIDQVWFTTPTGAADQIQTSESAFIVTADTGLDMINTAQSAPNTLVEYEVLYDGSMLHDGVLGTAQALGMFYRDTNLAPVIGTQLTSIGGGNNSYMHDADIGTTDSGTPFRAYLRTKPYIIGGLWNKFGLMAAALIALATNAVNLTITMIRNFGVEQRSVSISLTPFGSESNVVKPIDNASMSDLNVIQLEYGDATAVDSSWSVDQMVFKIRDEEGSAG